MCSLIQTGQTHASVEAADGARDLDLAVVICTRNRPAHLRQVLDAVISQVPLGTPVVVVDQSDEPASAAPLPGGDRVRRVVDSGRGLSRARNIGWRSVHRQWIAFLDDDCVPEPDWADQLACELQAHPDADFVAGHIAASHHDSRSYAAVVSNLVVTAHRRYAGRLPPVWKIGVGVATIRRAAIERVGGWDERLGAGTRDFPAAEDMDFCYRLLRSGGVAYAVPTVRIIHEQVRRPRELVGLQRDRQIAWAGFALKHMKTGDRLGGAMLWVAGLMWAPRMLASGVRRRTRLRWRIGVAMVAGIGIGTLRGLRASW